MKISNYFLDLYEAHQEKSTHKIMTINCNFYDIYNHILLLLYQMNNRE